MAPSPRRLVVAALALAGRSRAMSARGPRPGRPRRRRRPGLAGININRVISVTFMIGSALAAVAGVMVTLYYGVVHFFMGYLAGIKAFTAAVLGGIGSIPGAMLGGLMLGLIENFGARYISSVYKDAFAFVVLIITLIIRPSGLLGERTLDKV